VTRLRATGGPRWFAAAAGSQRLARVRAAAGSRRLALLAAGVLGALALVALAAPVLAPYPPTLRSGAPFAAPSAAHLLGTDDVGHDLLAELIYGGRVSLRVGVSAALAATLLGATVGLLTGYARGWVDAVLMRVVDVVLCLPVLPLTIVVGVLAGPGLSTQILVITSVIWAGVARELRSQVLSLRERDYLQALRAMGAGAGYVLPRHVLPAVAPLVVPQFVLAVRTAVLLEASLAFLGLGDLTRQSWGTMLAVAHDRGAFLSGAWLWWVLPPGLALSITVLAFALLGYVLDHQTPSPAAPSREGPPASTASRGSQHTESGLSAHPLVVEGLTVSYPGRPSPAVHRVSLHVAAGELLGLVGESGSGKSTLAAAVTGLLPPGATRTAGRIGVGGVELTAMAPEQLRTVRGDRVALVPQEAMSALNPVRTVRTVRRQLVTALRVHRPEPRARERAAELLREVGLDPDRHLDAYPHQLSGGMRQRAVIALALANRPAVLVADEPTSGLDVLAQAELLELLGGLRRRLDLAVLLISHDLPVVERVADRIAVLRAGELVEIGPAHRIGTAPEHPYTRHLVSSAPRLARPADSGDAGPTDHLVQPSNALPGSSGVRS
jgi:ABC-type dipeptide/oligopeptide/nickel transport system ATPase component/ABC-type dipeptide/oligopeptide/nickel transport system permease subunit